MRRWQHGDIRNSCAAAERYRLSSHLRSPERYQSAGVRHHSTQRRGGSAYAATRRTGSQINVVHRLKPPVSQVTQPQGNAIVNASCRNKRNNKAHIVREREISEQTASSDRSGTMCAMAKARQRSVLPGIVRARQFQLGDSEHAKPLLWQRCPSRAAKHISRGDKHVSYPLPRRRAAHFSGQSDQQIFFIPAAVTSQS